MDKRHRSPRVLALVENNPYPFDIRVRPHAEALVNAGYDVTVLCPREKNQASREVIGGVTVFRFPMPVSGTGSIHYIAEFVWATVITTAMVLLIWIRQGFDVLHLYTPPDSLFVAALLPKLAGKIIIYDNRDLSPELYEAKFGHTKGALYRLLLWLERRAVRLANHVLLVNDSYRQRILERSGIPEDRASVLRIGPELNRVRIVAPDPDLRARASTIIAYLGQMAKQDGVDHLLRALRHLDVDFGYRDWFCVLVGRADEPQVLEDLAADLGIADRTWFTGYVSDETMLRCLCSADICVDPDPANALNDISTMVKLMEYLALARPVVAYDLTEHRVTAGDAALYARPNDEMDMARQLAHLIKQPALRAELGARARQRAEQLSWEQQREHLLSLYSRLTGWGEDDRPTPDEVKRSPLPFIIESVQRDCG